MSAALSVRSERAFWEELDYNLLFRWFLGMQLMERSFDATVSTKNRLRLLEHQVGQQLFDEVVLAADRRSLLSDEHFTVDGTLIEAAASLKSFKPRGADPPDDGDRGNPSVDFHGDRVALGADRRRRSGPVLPARCPAHPAASPAGRPRSTDGVGMGRGSDGGEAHHNRKQRPGPGLWWSQA